MYRYLWIGVFAALFLIGCKKDEATVLISTTSGNSASLSSVSPSDGTASVPVSGSLSLTFSSAMSAGSLTTNQSGTSCAGSIQLSADDFVTCLTLGTPSLNAENKVATLAYSGLLNATTYKAKVTTAATSSSGVAFSAAYQWYFITISATTTTATTGTTATTATTTTTTADTTAPASPSISLNAGATSTLATSVTLSLSATDAVGVAAYYASESSSTPLSSATGWASVTSATSYSATPSFTLSSGLATKTVYVWFKDAAGNVSTVSSDTLILTSTWIKQAGTTGIEYAPGFNSDTNGNLYSVGSTAGGLDSNTNLGGTDIYFSKYNADGARQWTIQRGTASNDAGKDIIVDGSGSIFVYGETYASLDSQTPGGTNDIFLSKFDNAGTLVWTKQKGTSVNEFAGDIALDGSGNIYVCGGTYGVMAGTNAGNTDFFIVKYDSIGAVLWTKQSGSTGADSAQDIAVDSSGNVYMTGSTTGVSLDAQANADVSGLTSDIFITKYNTSGVRQWTRLAGTAGADVGRSLVIGADGFIYVTGSTSGTLAGNAFAGGTDIFTSKYDSAGALQWTKLLGTTGADVGWAITPDSSGNLYVAGSVSGAVDSNSFVGGSDISVSKYDASGNYQWTKQTGSTGADTPRGIVVDATGNIFLGGQTTGSLSGYTNAGGNDLWLMKNPTGYLP